MTSAPRSGAEEVEVAETTTGLLQRILRYEHPPEAANGPGADVIELRRRNETLNGSRVEQAGLWGNVTDFFMTRTETRSELYGHGTEVEGDLGVVSQQARDLHEVWTDERRLREHNDRLERYNRRYGDQARHLIAAEVERQRLVDGGEPEPVRGVIDENSTPADIAAVQAEQEENRLRQEAVEQWERFAVREGDNGRWRAKGLFSSALSVDNIRERWQNRTSLWSFFRTLGADTAQWRAVRSMVPTVNVVSYSVGQARDVAQQYGEVVETAGEVAELAVEGRRTQREVQREGAETVVIVSENLKDGLARVARGEMSREAFVRSSQQTLRTLQRQNPEEFAAMLQRSGMRARALNTRAGLYEFMRRTTHWYLHPSERVAESLWAENETAIPVWGSVAAWRDIREEDGLPLWARVGFASVGTVLDVGTVLSLGTLTPLTAGARALVGKGARMLARRQARTMARETVETGVRMTAAQQARALLGAMPRAARQAISVPGAGRFLTGAAAYTGLSYTLDWVFAEGLDHFVMEQVIEEAGDLANQEFTREQRRLLRLTGHEIRPLLEDAYDAYRDEAVIVVDDPAGDGALTDAELADMDRRDEARQAA